jgi:hypothetical protein
VASRTMDNISYLGGGGGKLLKVSLVGFDIIYIKKEGGGGELGGGGGGRKMVVEREKVRRV